MDLTLNSETKVGIFTLVALLGMVSLFMWLSGSQFLERGYRLEAVFDRIEGLRPGAPVKYNGVDVGRISEVYFDDLKIIVAMRIQSEFKIPHRSKALIASSSVVGDKYLELMPLERGEKPLPGDRIIGKTPMSMEQIYVAAYEAITSLREIADSIKTLTGDPEVTQSIRNSLQNMERISKTLDKFSGQFQTIDLAGFFRRLDHIAAISERLAQNNEGQLDEIVRNINQSSAQLLQASLTANQFLQKADASGELGTNLKKTLANAERVTENLEQFSALLSSKDQDIEQLMTDAGQAMSAINQAAQSINNAVQKLTAGDDSTLAEIQQTVGTASQAAKRVNDYVKRLQQIRFANSLGVGSHRQDGALFSYRLDSSFDEKNGLRLQIDDIGEKNQATMQWMFTNPGYTSRVGLYQNKFGVGIDYPATSKWTVGVDLWDTHAAKLGISSSFQLPKNWSMSLEASTELDSKSDPSQEESWRWMLWRKF
ncbi:MlaD family protein [Hydrogenispora ethanolica]|uniref:MlaD family protein n=1 Tax=Hydrogenispora ethanolica TaxID=1082276 RepID=UPI001048B43B|nr:MlaD family protein [Hydrogenispora ethanolica]